MITEILDLLRLYIYLIVRDEIMQSCLWYFQTFLDHFTLNVFNSTRSVQSHLPLWIQNLLLQVMVFVFLYIPD